MSSNHHCLSGKAVSCWAVEACTGIRFFPLAALVSVHREAGLQGLAEMLLSSYTCRRSAPQLSHSKGEKNTSLQKQKGESSLLMGIPSV